MEGGKHSACLYKTRFSFLFLHISFNFQMFLSSGRDEMAPQQEKKNKKKFPEETSAGLLKSI